MRMKTENTITLKIPINQMFTICSSISTSIVAFDVSLCLCSYIKTVILFCSLSDLSRCRSFLLSIDKSMITCWDVIVCDSMPTSLFPQYRGDVRTRSLFLTHMHSRIRTHRIKKFYFEVTQKYWRVIEQQKLCCTMKVESLTTQLKELLRIRKIRIESEKKRKKNIAMCQTLTFRCFTCFFPRIIHIKWLFGCVFFLLPYLRL